MMGDAVMPHVISNWHPFSDVKEQGCHVFDKLMLQLFLHSNISSCCCKDGGAEERVRAHDKYIVLSCLFSQLHNSFLVSFISLFHHCQSLPFSAFIMFAFSHSASICFLFVLSLLLPPLFYSLTFFPSWGLRPAVAVWFELFQVFS